MQIRTAGGIILVCLSILGVASHIPDAAAEFIQLFVYLDKVTYTPSDDSVRVTGCLSSDSSSVLGRQVQITVYDPDGVQVHTESASVNESCIFATDIDTRRLDQQGNYLVVADYEERSDKKAFRFSDESNQKLEGECVNDTCSYYFELRDMIYKVQYKLTSGKLESIYIDSPARALMIVVNSTAGNGTFTAILPRSVIDSQQNGTDTRYMVFVGSLTNGVGPVDFEEAENTEDGRVLVIDYPGGQQTLISISGTYLAPEFGPAMMLAAVVLAGVVIASALTLQNTSRRATDGGR